MSNASSSPAELDALVDQLKTNILEHFFGLTHKEFVALVNERKDDMERIYYRFFHIISQELMDIDGDEDTTPPRLVGHMGANPQWQRLTDDWQERKLKADAYDLYYNGLTDMLGSPVKAKLGAARQGAKRDKKFSRSAKTMVEPFDRFMKKLGRDPNAVDRILGRVSVTYSFGAPNVTMRRVQNGNQLRQIMTQGAKGRFTQMPRAFVMDAEISAFDKLKGVDFDEWHVVDFILKRLDPANEHQWVKINSRYGFGKGKKGKRGPRPIRAIISPMINWFIQKGIPDTMKDPE